MKDHNLSPSDLQSNAVAFLIAQRFFLQPAPDLRYNFAPLSYRVCDEISMQDHNSQMQYPFRLEFNKRKYITFMDFRSSNKRQDTAFIVRQKNDTNVQTQLSHWL